MEKRTTFVGNQVLTEDMVEFIFSGYSYDQVSAAVTELWNDRATRVQVERFVEMCYSWYSRMMDEHINVHISSIPYPLKDYITDKSSENGEYRFDSFKELNGRIDDAISEFDTDFENYNNFL